MKTQNNTLAFRKSAITELNQDQLNKINGGTNVSIINPNENSLSCSFCINSSNGAGGDLLNQIRE